MLSLLFANIVLMTQKLTWVGKPKESCKILGKDGTIRPGPTFDMLVTSDITHLHSMTDCL